VRFRPVYYVPTFSKYSGEVCAGVHLYITDRATYEPVATALHLIATARRLYPDHFAWREPWSEGARRPIDLLTGGDLVRQHFNADGSVEALLDQWKEGLDTFEQTRSRYLLY